MTEISAYPEPGEYNDTISVRLETENRTYWSYRNDLPDNAWLTKPTVPLPVRSHCGVLGTNLVGGIAASTPLALNDRYDPVGESWICDTDLPAPVESPAASKDIVLGSIETHSWCAKFKDSTWIAKPPCMKSVRGYSLQSFQDRYYLFGNDTEIIEHKQDSWIIVGENPVRSEYSASTSLDRIYFTSQEGIIAFDTNTNTARIEVGYQFEKGQGINCAHDNHFLVVGTQSLRVDLATSSVHVNDPLPLTGRFIAAENHLNFAGLKRNNACLEYRCIFGSNEYKDPIPLTSKGIYTIFVKTLNERLETTKTQSVSYKINSYLLRYVLTISGTPLKIRWPNCKNEDNENLSYSDILPDDPISIQENAGPIRWYNHELLERYPDLNRELLPGVSYTIRSNSSDKTRVLIEAYAPIEKTGN